MVGTFSKLTFSIAYSGVLISELCSFPDMDMDNHEVKGLFWYWFFFTFFLLVEKIKINVGYWFFGFVHIVVVS